MTGQHGQAIVETALVLPVFLFALLMLGEVAFLVATQHGIQRDADAVADWVAIHPGEDYSTIVTDVGLGACVVTVDSTTDLATVGATCSYSTRVGLLDGIPVSVESVATVAGAVAGATGSPSPSATATP